MVHAVDWSAVEKDEVLVRASAPDDQSGKAFVAALHARYGLQGLKHV